MKKLAAVKDIEHLVKDDDHLEENEGVAQREGANSIF